MSLSTSLLDCLFKSIMKTKQHLSHFNVSIWLGVNRLACIAIFTAVQFVFINTFVILTRVLPINSELKSHVLKLAQFVASA